MERNSVIEALASYICEAAQHQISTDVRRIASSFFADGFACLVGGIQSRPAQIAAEWVKQQGCERYDANVFGYQYKTSAANAALVNGIAAHYLDYDDVSYSSNAHASAVLVPTVLAVGQMCHASGCQVLDAYIIGVEIVGLLGRLMGDEAFRKGWHTTSLLGVFGATAAAGKLLGLHQQEMAYALSLAASEASGNKGNFGTMAKAFHAGSAASKGVRCAQLCQMGFDANVEVFETHGGFQELIVRQTDREALDAAIRNHVSEFQDPGMVMKPYPTCKAGHNGIYAAFELSQEYHLKPEDIRHIEVRVQAYAPDTLRFRIPKNGLEGRFSMHYGIALAIVRGKISLEDFSCPAVDDPDLIALMKRIDMVVDESLSGGKVFSARGDTVVTIECMDGSKYERRADYAVGDPHKPMTEAQKQAKWMDCFSCTLDPDTGTQLLCELERLESLEDINQLCTWIL